MIITGSIATITSDVEVSEDNRVHLYLNGTNAQGIVVHMNKDEAQRVSDLLGHAVQDIMLKEVCDTYTREKAEPKRRD